MRLTTSIRQFARTAAKTSTTAMPYKKPGAAAGAAVKALRSSTTSSSTRTEHQNDDHDTSTPQGLAKALADSGAIPPLSRKSKIRHERTIQSLWASYGTITELELEVDVEDDDDDDDDESGAARRKKKTTTTTTTTVIIKRVKPPRGNFDGDIGHRRKLESYVAEAAFYQHCARATRVGGAAIAEPLLVSTSDDDADDNAAAADGKNQPPRFSLTLVLSDLRGEFPVFTRGALRPEQLRAALRWLARFHAIWWGCGAKEEGEEKEKKRKKRTEAKRDGDSGGGVGDGVVVVVGGFDDARAAGRCSASGPDSVTDDNHDGGDDGDGDGDGGGDGDDPPTPLPPELAGREGTFWHLDTRPDEWEAIPEDGGFLSGLKGEAAGIAADLKEETRKFPVLVHGDAKAANFAFSADGGEAAAYDFQYVGLGVGARDVAYLLSSAGSSSGGDRELESSLDLYYEALAKNLESLGKGDVLEEYTRGVLGEHFRLATADFYRFMAGWGTWGGGASRAERIAREVVEERRRRRKS